MSTASVVPFGLGRETKALAVCETTFDTFVRPAAKDSFRLLNYTAQPSQERVNRTDARPGRGIAERISRIKLVEWSCETYVLPRDTDAGDLSDIDPLLVAAMGSVDGGTDKFELVNGSSLPTISAVFAMDDIFQEIITGAWVNEFGLTASSGDEPRFTFSGGAATHIHTSSGDAGVDDAGGPPHVGTVTANKYATIDTDPVGGDTISLDPGHARNFEIGSWVKTVTSAGLDVDTDLRVTNVNYTTDTLTVVDVNEGSPATSLSAVTAGGTVRPYDPFAHGSTDGIPATMIDGVLELSNPDIANDPYFSTADNDLIVSAFEFTLNNNIKPLDNIAFRDKVSGFIAGFREVSGSITLHGRQDNFLRLNSRKFFDRTLKLKITLGDPNGIHYVIEFPKVEINGDSTLEVPDSSSNDESTITLNWMALASTVNATDEFTILRVGA